VAHAQQPAMPVIGYLGLRSAQDAVPELALFRQGLGEVGYVEGKNVTIEYRWGDGEAGRMPALAAEFVRRPVAIIFADSTTAALAVKEVTSTLPMVFRMGGGDPVKLGLAASLNRPGSNATGVTNLSATLETKVLGLLRELVPDVQAVAALLHPDNPNFEKQKHDLQEAGHTVGKTVHVFEARTAPEIDDAFRVLVQRRTSALIVGAAVFFDLRRQQITTLAAHYRIPAIYQSRKYVEADGLMSYGTSGNGGDLIRVAGVHVGRILKGEKPADLPVQQPTKFELVINLKTAKALGLAIPETLLATADEVIQ
jgi:putative ABC transport system substrate-binding protein